MSESPKRILLVGLRSSAVDFEKWPELSVEKLEAAFQKVALDLKAAGYSPQWCLTDTGETAEDQVRTAIASVKPDVILVGAGVRTDPDHFLLFEKLVNLIHSEAPSAGIAFNTNPLDSVEAVKRWI